MSGELPKRIIEEGEETQVAHINNNCRLDHIITRLAEWLPNELKDVKKDQVFSQIFSLHESGLGYSARVIHSFLCRELVTYKLHELWFVFARRPLRFSLVEFHAITGLECNVSLSQKEFEDWEDDGGFWSKVLKRKEGISILTLWKKHREAVKKWRNVDRIRLVYICIIVGVVLARDEKANIPLKYIKVVIDLQKLRRYPWGVASFDLLCDSIAKTREKLKEKTTSYVLDGFSYALQIWVMEAVPKIEKLCGKRLNKGFANGPRCINWRGAAKVSYEEIIRLEKIFAPEAVAPSERQKQHLLAPYSIVEVPLKGRLNKSCCDCGAYALKHLECHVLDLDLSLVDDEIIHGCREKIAIDLWEAAHDPILAQVLREYIPSAWETSEVFDLAED